VSDKVLRDEILESPRWLRLPTDSDRLAYIGLLLACDDFGNLEGGTWRLARYLTGFTQIKSEEHCAVVLTHLADADMIRAYKVDEREYYHLPRLRPHRQYIVRKHPPSPWDETRPLGKTQRVALRGVAKYQALTGNVVTTSQPRGNDVAQGVGVGVGVGVGENPSVAKATLSGKPDPAPPEKTPEELKAEAEAAKKLAEAQELRKHARGVLAFLNSRAGRKFPPTDSNVGIVVARLKEGFTVEQIRQVVANRIRKWSSDEKMVEYLRPMTLFARRNFSNYVGELADVDPEGAD
jgi:uncharacterized phage protein (TIGR02220 family)